MADEPSNPLVAFVERIRAAKPTYDWQPALEEPHWIERKLVPCPPPKIITGGASLEATRQLLRDSIRSYLEIEVPDHLLLIRSIPGTGKTQAAVEIIDDLIAQGKRVAYAGPRHDFFTDVLAKTALPEQWYEWLPRQSGDYETCRYTPQISEWLNKGYEAMDFCAGVCGWDYVNDGCPYHRQKARRESAIYVQHQHVALGHPLQFDVLFGDESPIGAFLHEWRIPARWVCPPGMDYTHPLTELLHLLAAITQAAPRAIQGPELLEALGGAQLVLDACADFDLPATALAAGSIHYPESVSDTPYFHLGSLVNLLSREAACALHAQPYPQRIIAANAHLTLLLRRTPDLDHLPNHIVWLDATGQADIYARLFGKRVEQVDAAPRLHGNIYQLVDRANGKSAVDPSPSERIRRKTPGKMGYARQAEQLIGRIIEKYAYRQPSLISYKGFVADLDLEIKTAHFYAARGTNEHQDADAVFIVGAPQPNIYDVVKLAKMIYFERDIAFDVRWTTMLQPYAYVGEDGLGRCYPVSGFWFDHELQRVLELLRDDEIVQAAHRGRPVNHPVDIWLLTNIPITSLPPDQLFTMRDVLDSPLGVNIWKWADVQALMERQDTITIADLVNLGINYETAKNYLKIIVSQPGWEMIAVKTGKRGNPPRVAQRITDCSIFHTNTRGLLNKY